MKTDFPVFNTEKEKKNKLMEREHNAFSCGNVRFEGPLRYQSECIQDVAPDSKFNFC